MALWLETKDGNEHPTGPIPDAIPCYRCGLCCIFFLIKLSTIDIHVLAQGLGISRRDFARKYVKKTPVGPVLKQDRDDCVFLKHVEADGRAECSVYDFRPEVCRNWVPSLSRPECREGLRRLRQNQEVLLPTEIYASEDDVARLCSVFKKGLHSDPTN